MKNRIWIFVTFLLFLFIATDSFSQRNFSVHLGPSIPVSEFTSDKIDHDGAGGAAVGLNIGLKYVFPVTKSGLGIFGGLDANYNGLKKDVQYDVEKMFENLGIYDADYTFYRYLNIPISVGLNYNLKVDKVLTFHVNFGATANFLKVSDLTIRSGNQKITSEFDWANSFGFKTGGGILINDRTSVSLEYWGLGKNKIKGTMTAFGQTEDIDWEQKVQILTLTIGFHF